MRQARSAALFAILALLGGMVALLASPSATSDERGLLQLPALGNTDAHDRVLMQEIGDDHVFSPSPSSLASEPAPTESDALTAALSDTPAARSSATAGDVNDGATPAIAEPAAGAPTDAGEEPPALARAEPSDVPEQLAAPGPWQRIRASTRLPVSDRPEVQAFREQYEDEAMWVDRILARAGVFIEHMVDALDARYLPVELALLPAVESGFRPDVLSRGQAAGLWQIVPITAREIGIERSAWFDGRADTVTSTTAAIDYLSYLNAAFNGDWELTLAAYNAGPGRVQRAMKRNRKDGKPVDFWSLPLPQETRDYVPKMFALVQMVKDPEAPLQVPEGEPPIGFEIVDAGVRISLDKAAKLADLPEAELRRLNAGLLHGVTAPAGPHTLYLPRGTAEAFLARLASADRSTLFSLPTRHDVVAGDTLSDIAERYGMRQRQLMDLNGLDDSRIMIGQTLNVRDNRAASLASIEYVVSIGDTLSDIARRHSVSRSAIRDAQGEPLASDLIHPGETLTIDVTLGGAG